MANKKSRVEKFVNMLNQFLDRGSISYAQACELHGLMNFAVGYFSGRSLKHAVSACVPPIGGRGAASTNLLRSLCEYIQRT